MDNSQLWTEKYRPNTLNKVLGSPTNITNIKTWANSFKGGTKPQFPAILLSGPPGIGKTSIAYALSKDYDWPITEFNASDTRTYESIMEEVAPIAITASIKGKIFRKLILLDEVDSLYTNTGKQDKTAIKAILTILKHTKHPIIFTCNSEYDVPKEIKDYCVLVTFQRIREGTIRKTLANIAKSENISPSIEVINSCISKGDLRASITNLQASSFTHTLLSQFHDQKLTPFEVVESIFRCTDISNLNNILINSEISSPEEAILWIAENVTQFYKGIELVNAYKQLSKADIYLKKARHTRNYHYWSLAVNHMTIGVALSRKRPITTNWVKVEFPSYLKKMSATKHKRGLVWKKDGFAHKLGLHYHMSSHSFMNSTFPLVQKLCINDPSYLLKLKLQLELNEKEIALLLDTSESDPRIKKIMSPEFQISQETEATIQRQQEKAKPLLNYFR